MNFHSLESTLPFLVWGGPDIQQKALPLYADPLESSYNPVPLTGSQRSKEELREIMLALRQS